MQDNTNANVQNHTSCAQSTSDVPTMPNLPNMQNTQNTENTPKKDSLALFSLRYEKFHVFYLLVVLAAIISLGVGIYIAVSEDLLWGSLILFAAVFIYVYFATSELCEKLGLWYKTDSGSLSVTKCRARYGNLFVVPSRLLWYDVEELCDKAFFSPANKNCDLVAIFLPKSLKRIGKDAFIGCSSLKTIYYEGSSEEWEKIINESSLTDVEVIFNAFLPKRKK